MSPTPSSQESLPSSEERARQVREAFKNMPYFPDKGVHHWEQFIAPYNKRGNKIPFAITLRKAPDSSFAYSTLLEEMFSKEVFFGILVERSDNKLGELCFGRASTDFGNSQYRLTSIFTKDDGFDADFLHVVRKNGRIPDCPVIPSHAYKVVEMDVTLDSVMSKLFQWLSPMIGGNEKEPPKDAPNEVDAANLAKLRKYLKRFLVECGDTGKKHDFSPLLRRFDLTIDLRIKQLEGRTANLEAELSETKKEISHLKD